MKSPSDVKTFRGADVTLQRQKGSVCPRGSCRKQEQIWAADGEAQGNRCLWGASQAARGGRLTIVELSQAEQGTGGQSQRLCQGTKQCQGTQGTATGRSVLLNPPRARRAISLGTRRSLPRGPGDRHSPTAGTGPAPFHHPRQEMLQGSSSVQPSERLCKANGLRPNPVRFWKQPPRRGKLQKMVTSTNWHPASQDPQDEMQCAPSFCLL